MMSTFKSAKRALAIWICLPIVLGMAGCADTVTNGRGRHSEVRVDNKAFAAFLACFPERTLPLPIPHDGDKSVRQSTKKLAKIPHDLADEFLAAYSSAFAAGVIENAEHPIYGYFNLPEFENVSYFAYGRLNRIDDWIPVVFCLDNNYAVYFGLAVYSADGKLKDQVFVAGQEGGSGNTYQLRSKIDKGLGVALSFAHRAESRSTGTSMFKLIFSVKETIIFEQKGVFRSKGFHSLKKYPLE